MLSWEPAVTESKGFDFEDAFTQVENPKSFLGKKYAEIKKRVRITETPPFPYSMQIEVTNMTKVVAAPRRRAVSTRFETPKKGQRPKK